MVIARTIDGEEVSVDEKDLHFSINLYAVVTKDGKVLISPQWKENGYDFPGGHLELGEHHLDGLVREVKEETGFVVKPTCVIDIFTSFFIHPHKKTAQQSLLVYYAADIVTGQISTEGFDVGEQQYAREARFVTLEELRTMQFMSEQQPLKSIMPYLEKQLGVDGRKTRM